MMMDVVQTVKGKGCLGLESALCGVVPILFTGLYMSPSSLLHERN